MPQYKPLQATPGHRASFRNAVQANTRPLSIYGIRHQVDRKYHHDPSYQVYFQLSPEPWDRYCASTIEGERYSYAALETWATCQNRRKCGRNYPSIVHRHALTYRK